MTLTDVLERLDPLQQKAVALVYFEGRSPNDAARFLRVETGVVGAALSAAYRRIARSVIDDDETTGRTASARVESHAVPSR